MAGQEIVALLWGYVQPGWELALGWLTSPAAWSQFGLLVAAFLLARLVARKVQPLAERFLTPAPGKAGLVAQTQLFLLPVLPLLLPLMAYGFTALGEAFTR